MDLSPSEWLGLGMAAVAGLGWLYRVEARTSANAKEAEQSRAQNEAEHVRMWAAMGESERRIIEMMKDAEDRASELRKEQNAMLKEIRDDLRFVRAEMKGK